MQLLRLRNHDPRGRETEPSDAEVERWLTWVGKTHGQDVLDVYNGSAWDAPEV